MDRKHDQYNNLVIHSGIATLRTDKFLIVKGAAGLGNRILSALTGILYARLACRGLIIDWSDPTYSNDGTNVFPLYFECSLNNVTNNIPLTDSVSPAIWCGHLHKTVGDMEKRHRNISRIESRRIFSIDLSKLDYNEDVLVMWSNTQRIDLLRSHFKGKYKEFALARADAILKKLLNEDLALRPRIKEHIDNFKFERFNKNTVGVHIRYTDRKTRLPDIYKKLDVLLKHDCSMQIFLATDNIEIKNMFQEKYTNVITTTHWYARPGLRIHGDRYCPDRTESGIEALTDLYLLAECDHLIIDTGSSFSYLAGLLSKAPGTHIYDVKRTGEKLPRRLWDLSWPHMVRLGLYPLCLSIFRKFIEV
jgi:hypothetical protein